MHFTFQTDHQDLAALRVDLCAVLLFEGEYAESPVLQALDQAFAGLLSRLLEEEQFSAKKSQCLTLHTHGKVGATRILFMGAGKRRDFQPSDLRFLSARVIRTANGSRSRSVAFVLPDEPEGTQLSAATAERMGQFLVEGALLGAYQFDRYWTGERKRPCTVAEVSVLPWIPGAVAATKMRRLPTAELHADFARGAKRGQSVARGIMLARDLVNESASEMTPRRLAAIAEQLSRDHGLSIEVLGPKECAELGMGLYLAVARGSQEEPRFLHLTYRPATEPRRRVALIGKSVTFDSGGLSLKTVEGMMDMKMDMGGGATVLGAALALSQLGCPDEVHILCAATENMPSGSAYKLGDVVRSMNGKTVEITNTDAEGRLTIADAITYTLNKIKPDEILDFATLTGASIVALGPNIAGVMSNHQETAGRLLGAARDSGEEMWQLPLPERMLEMLKSEVADLKNCAERAGGCITAGLFLKEFVGETPWVHVDMAGPVQATKEWGHQQKGATGFGVATIVEYLVPRSV